MTDIAQRYDKVATQFTRRVEGVPEGAWDNPAPCEGWLARDVVRHLAEWLPALFFGRTGLPLPDGPSADEDPVGAWAAVDQAIRAALADPGMAAREFDSPAGTMSLAQGVDMLGTPDVLMHTWDLARATGQDETLDADEVSRVYAGMEPFDKQMRASGHYGPRVPVPDDADIQTKLLAFIGRQP